MNIAIDATLLREDRLTGVERYIINLIKYIASQKKPLKIYVFFRNAIYSDLQAYSSKFTPVVIKSSNRIILDQFLLPFYAARYKIDLMHFPVFGAPILYRKKSILTIHDATFWLYPETISKGGRFYYKPLFEQSIKRANKIITVSDSSRQDLIRIFKLNPDNIVTIYEAVDQIFLKEYDEKKYLSTPYSKHKDNYILSVGTIEPRKNLSALIQAFKIIKTRYGLGVKLLLTGRHGWTGELKIPKEIEDDVIFTGFVEEDLLPALYKNACAYAFPSLYEGFGFPILEAFASGTPVVAANNSSLLEIGKDACIFADPSSPDEFAERIREVITDKVLRGNVIKKGYERLQDFNWEKCAYETTKLYALVIKSNA